MESITNMVNPFDKRVCMKKKIFHRLGQIVTYAPPVGILGASLLNLTTVERQYLILILIIWVNMFFLYKTWLGQ